MSDKMYYIKGNSEENDNERNIGYTQGNEEYGARHRRKKRCKGVYVVVVAVVSFLILALVMSLVNLCRYDSLSSQLKGLQSENTKLNDKMEHLQTDVNNLDYHRLKQAKNILQLQKKMEDNVDSLEKGVAANKHDIEKVDLKLDHLKELHEYQENHLANTKEHFTNITSLHERRLGKIEKEVDDMKRRTETVKVVTTKIPPTVRRVVNVKTPAPTRKITTRPKIAANPSNRNNGALNVKSGVLATLMPCLFIYFVNVLRCLS